MPTWIFIFTIITISFPVSDQSTPSTGQTGAPIMLIPGSGVSVPSDPRGPDGSPIILIPSTEAPNDDKTTIGPNAQVTGPGGRPIRLIPESQGSRNTAPSDPRGPDGSPIILTPPTMPGKQKNGVPLMDDSY